MNSPTVVYIACSLPNMLPLHIVYALRQVIPLSVNPGAFHICSTAIRDLPSSTLPTTPFPSIA
jgi:hypothetical protein